MWNKVKGVMILILIIGSLVIPGYLVKTFYQETREVETAEFTNSKDRAAVCAASQGAVASEVVQNTSQADEGQSDSGRIMEEVQAVQYRAASAAGITAVNEIENMQEEISQPQTEGSVSDQSPETEGAVQDGTDIQNEEQNTQEDAELKALQQKEQKKKEKEEKARKKREKKRAERKAKREAEKKARKKRKQQIRACCGNVMGSGSQVILERIVEAEAGGEDHKGKILVANVVLNRVKSRKFPNSIRGVVFANRQFSPIRDGRYYSVKVSKDTKKAVRDALNGVDYSEGALYFMERSIADSDNASWFDRCLTRLFRYKCHEFYK